MESLVLDLTGNIVLEFNINLNLFELESSKMKLIFDYKSGIISSSSFSETHTTVKSKKQINVIGYKNKSLIEVKKDSNISSSFISTKNEVVVWH